MKVAVMQPYIFPYLGYFQLINAAHCFGVEYKGENLFNYGDVSTCSFHATKIFHTGEGGAFRRRWCFFCKDDELNHKLFYSHNFGHKTATVFQGVGINAKMSELQAAMGLSVLPYMKEILMSRKAVCDFYDKNLDFFNFHKLKIREGTEWNYCYYPIIFESETDLLRVQNLLNENEIFPRRYFCPSLNLLDYFEKCNMLVSETVASRILCLPLSVGLKKKELKQICEIVNLKE